MLQQNYACYGYLRHYSYEGTKGYYKIKETVWVDGWPAILCIAYNNQ
jgi:hypothetical protein